MKTFIITVVSNTFKFLWSVVFIFILTQVVFIVLVLSNLKVPAIAMAKFVEYPVKIFWTEADIHNGRNLPDGTIVSFQKPPIDFTLRNSKDATDILHFTTLTGGLTVDVNNNRDILLVIFLKRIVLSMIFFILFFQLGRMFSTFRKNKPFNPANSTRLKIVAYFIMSLSPVIYLFNDLSIHIFKSYKITGYNSTITSHSLNLQYIFFGLLILIIAYAFDIGSQLQHESEYTI